MHSGRLIIGATILFYYVFNADDRRPSASRLFAVQSFMRVRAELV